MAGVSEAKQARPTPVTLDAIELLERPEPIGPRAFEVIYAHYKPILTRYAAKKGASDPEGIADLALVSGYKAINNLDNRTRDSFGYYLTRAALGHLTDEHRRSTVPTIRLGDHTEHVEDPADLIVDRTWLRDLVAELPTDQRNVIEHRYLADLSGVETANRLGKEANAVYQLQHRALGKLRRAIFPLVLALLAVVGGWTAWQARSNNGSVDSTPVDRVVEPSPVEEMSTTTTTPGPNTTAATVDPDVGAGFDLDLGSDQQSLAGGDEVNEIEQSEEATASTEPPSAPTSPQSDPADFPSNNQQAEAADGDNTATTVVATTTPPQPEPSTTLNMCQPHLIDLQTLAVRLYNPQSDHDRASKFLRPAAVRFLDADGDELVRVSTAGEPTTSSAANSHGWMGEGGGTHAEFAQAPTPTYWGVLVNADLVTNWSAVQALDPSTLTWSTVGGCP